MPSKYRPPVNAPEEDPGVIENLLRKVGLSEKPTDANTFVGPQEEPGYFRKYAPHVVRGASGFLGFTPLTGAVSGGVGETIAEMIEKGTFNPLEVDPRRVAAETATGAVMGKYAKGLGEAMKLGKTGLAMVKGGTMGASAPVIRHGIEHGDVNPMNYPGEILAGGAIGAASGGLMSKAFGPKAEHLSINPDAVPTTPSGGAPPPPGAPSVSTSAPLPKGKAGLRIALDDLKKVPQTSENPYASNLNSELYGPSVPNTPETLQRHAILAKEQTRNPRGPIASEIGPPVEKPSLVEMEQLHSDAMGGVSKDAIQTEKAHNVAMKERVDAAKSETAAAQMVGKEKADAAKAHTKYVEGEATREAANEKARRKFIQNELTQDTRNESARQRMINRETTETSRSLNAQQKYRRGVEIARAQADVEELKRGTEAAAKKRISDFMDREDVEPSEQNVTETVRAKSPEGDLNLRQSFRVKPPEDPEAGGAMPTGEPVSPKGPMPKGGWTKDVVKTNMFRTKEEALEAGSTLGAGHIERLGRGKYRFVFKDDLEAPPPPTSTPAPKGPNPKDGDGGAAPTPEAKPSEMAPSLERSVIEGKRYTNKQEAAAIAKATGGQVHQYGPRKYRVVFSPEEAPAAPHVDAEPTPIQKYDAGGEAPKYSSLPTKDEPIPVAPNPRGNLTPEEFRRYMDIRPAHGIKRTPEEAAEYVALHRKMNQKAELTPEVSDSPILHQIEAEVPPAQSSTPHTPEVIEESSEALEDRARKSAAYHEKNNDPISARNALLSAEYQAALRKKGILGGKAPDENTHWDTVGEASEAVKNSRPDIHNAIDPEAAAELASEGRRDGISSVEPHVNPVGEAEPVLPGVDPTVNPEAKPVAEVPFSLERQVKPRKVVGSKSMKFEESQNNQMDEFMDALHGADEPLPQINPEGHGTIPADPPPATTGEPTPPQGGAIPARLFSSRVEAAGEGYGAVKAAKKLGEKVPEEGRRAAAAAAQRVAKEDAPNLTIEQISKLRPEDQDKILAQQVKAAREGLKGQKGEINPAIPMHLLGAGGGAAVGAAADDEHPLRGAAVGAGLGLAGAYGASKLPGILRGDETAKEAFEPIVGRLPNYLRGSLLSDPRSIVNNSVGGPWGSHFFGGLEEYLKGKAGEDVARSDAGRDALKTALNPKKWGKGWIDSFGEASQKIHDSDELGRAGRFIDPDNPNIVDRMAELPATYMLAGDLNTRNFLQDAGIPDDVVRKITNTAEPSRAIWKNFANWGKAKSGPNDEGDPSTIAQMMLPFKRTAANIMENGTERTPILGSIINAFGDPELKIPMREQLVQQGIGGMVFGLGYAAGANTSEQVNKDFKIHSLVSNLGGNYALLANAGFMAGQAVRNGKAAPEAVVNEFLNGGMPLPSTQPITDVAKTALKFGRGEGELSDTVPSIAKPKIMNFLLDEAPEITKRYTNDTQSGTRTASSGNGQSRYRPRKPRGEK